MKKFLYFTLCLCALLVVSTSCSGKNSDGSGKYNEEIGSEIEVPRNDNELVGGIWKRVAEQGLVEAYATLEFMNGGKLFQTAGGSSYIPYMEFEIEGDCTYTFEEGVITIKFTGENFNITKFEAPGESSYMVKMYKDALRSGITEAEQVYTDVKIDGDKMTAIFQGEEVTFTRKY